MPEALTLLREHFGHAGFRGIQRAVIERVLAGAPTLAIMPTGGGKSLTYQLPALMLPGTVIVVSPLIALMHDQMRAARTHGIRAATLTSADPDRDETLRRLRSGGLDLLYVAPERAAQSAFAEVLAGLPIPLFAIDEAHCVSEWGHDFRRDYRALRPLLDAHPQAARLALTATADAHTRADLCSHFAIPPEGLVMGGFDRPNICYTIEARDRPVERLTRLLRDEKGAGIIYCRTRAETERLALALARSGRHVLPYHAGMTDERRAAHQRLFFERPGVVMVATIAFGMGIDKPDVRFVAHTCPPRSVEAYYQETGRAGRDGKPALALMLWSARDLADGAPPPGSTDPRAIIAAQRQQAMADLIRSRACRRAGLLRYFGQRAGLTCGHCDNCRRGRTRTALAGAAGHIGRLLIRRPQEPAL
ncbi:MAG TPA: ATP-dependent DNA helicase RecQ [Novosphingobium sp.]|nr:ATP-dependent DNA helicase RecQ [Novosphingobium sp.]